MLRKDIHYFVIGVVISTFVVYQLVNLIMSEEVDPIDDFSSFATFSNIVFSIHMWVLFMSGWVYKGRHNRNLLLLWTVGHIINLAIYYQLMELFLVHWRNIYALNFVSAISFLVLYSLIVQRRNVMDYLYRHSGIKIFCAVSETKFEVYLVEFMRVFITFEILFALALTAYGLAYRLSPGDSFSETIRVNNHPDFFDWYFNILAFFTIYLTIVFIRHAFIELRHPDRSACQLSTDEKLMLIKRMNKRF